MNLTKVALIREGKVPPDKRVALTPIQCKELMERFPSLQIVVQKSPIRAISDAEYANHGIELGDDVSDCDIMIGVKEVNIDDLIPDKTYLFFSHTFKKQPYNRDLLRAILNKRIRLIDYEVMTYSGGGRVLGFGRYAGIVGAYNSLLAYGRKTGLFSLKPAHQCFDRTEVERELAKVKFPDNFRMVMTGFGRVGMGAREIIDLVPVEQVSHHDFLERDFDRPVFTHINVENYNIHRDGKDFSREHFYTFPEEYLSTFLRYAHRAQLYIACHYWGAGSPYIFTRDDAKHPDFALQVVGDISCDIDGPVASTLRPSTIADPHYGYHPQRETEVDFMHPEAIGVMVIDNLPCELPRDASQDFGGELMEKVIPCLMGHDDDGIIERATQTTLQGELAPAYAYLKDYVAGKE